MELREQIAKIIINHVGNKALDEADVILSLPSGMEKVKECIRCNATGFTQDMYGLGKFVCDHCNGAGEIVTDLTVGEAIEWAKAIAIAYEGADEYGYPMLTPHSERIRLRK